MQDIERNVRSMQNDMTKLNTLITKESGLREALQQGTVLMESDFIQALKVSQRLHVPKNIWARLFGCSNPGLKVDRGFNFSCIKVFFKQFVTKCLIYFQLRTTMLKSIPS